MMGTLRVPLTQGKYALIDEEDAERVSQRSWQLLRTRNDDRFYAESNRHRSKVSMHRFIMSAKDGEEIDHWNHDGLDNRRCNLRSCNDGQNSTNARRIAQPSRAGFRGVHPCGKKWQAAIAFEHKLHYLGIFETPEDAAYAYDAKARELHGEFAMLNFPDEKAVPEPVIVGTLEKPPRYKGYRGVSKSSRSNLWFARLKHQGKTYCLGRYEDIEDAARAYDAKAREIFGDAAWQNVPNGEGNGR